MEFINKYKDKNLMNNFIYLNSINDNKFLDLKNIRKKKK